MKQSEKVRGIHSNTRNWLFVEMPDGANIHNVYCRSDGSASVLFYFKDKESNSLALPDGEYLQHCIADEATKAQAAKVLQPVFLDNNTMYLVGEYKFFDPVAGLAVLVMSHFGNTGKRYLILEKCVK